MRRPSGASALSSGTAGSSSATVSPIHGRAPRCAVNSTHSPRNGCQRSSQVTGAWPRSVTVRSSHSFADTVTVMVPAAGRTDHRERAPVERVVRRRAERLLGARAPAAESLEHRGPVDRDRHRSVVTVDVAIGVDDRDLDERELAVGRFDLCAVDVHVEMHGTARGRQRHATGFGSGTVRDRDELAGLRTWSRTRRRRDGPHRPAHRPDGVTVRAAARPRRRRRRPRP